MSAQPAERSCDPPGRLRTSAEIRRALPEGVRAEFDQAISGAALTERAHVLALWSGIAIEAAGPSGEGGWERTRWSGTRSDASLCRRGSTSPFVSDPSGPKKAGYGEGGGGPMPVAGRGPAPINRG
ncbi:hypothetical protein I5Q34_17770 [Streptomyces sp. AV19]|uniref:hypothetical protein n=1 Tax=Streptomyces sp. AV19 TaxID=2793068 RepID=UPI0018FE35C9|nr:hypothetical protein [Streptomyces sp. AV19]MBH1936095.1 hypothetical protein [Streptomyces sp. AV19]MDG4534110.1 hypothetical protein [Streptomyces sp. AV19]